MECFREINVAYAHHIGHQKNYQKSSHLWMLTGWLFTLQLKTDMRVAGLQPSVETARLQVHLIFLSAAKWCRQLWGTGARAPHHRLPTIVIFE